ncbi:MAG: Rieske (2Fe-2S) protein [Planctomycetota bacterium]
MDWYKLCNRDELAENSGHEFVLNGLIIAVFLQEGEIRAIDGMCAHQGGPIAQGQLHGDCVTCPWHGWQYDVTNGCNLLTKKKMLDVFETQWRDDELWIALES